MLDEDATLDEIGSDRLEQWPPEQRPKVLSAREALGRLGEQLAVDYLSRCGFEILERNWRCRQGEIDIIAREGRHVVFVEVKARSGSGYGHPLEAITPVKLRRLRQLATLWCDERKPAAAGIRIDAIAVLVGGGPEVRLEHVRDLTR